MALDSRGAAFLDDHQRPQFLASGVQAPQQVPGWDEEAEFSVNDTLLEPVEQEEVEGTRGSRPSKHQRRAAEHALSLLRIRRVMTHYHVYTFAFQKPKV
ncbi:hypothetical protein EIP91_004371 [Steccherinum ochraceum]|uniref:Uncharacterized protein n=1 Tax=Steccherinum ochraceum TaxID=92696 RepID=A0A4R0RSK0_9APHY|nr:hypothetical protein EIP91_004371 [Steccherinum ochraceum]